MWRKLSENFDGYLKCATYYWVIVSRRIFFFMRDRLFYIDNIRIFTIGLVVLHHFATSYGATGDWYYVEGAPDNVFFQIPLTMFTATNQAFFMGLLFFVSAYFVNGSYERKGPRVFIKERLIRLGIPMVAYIFLLQPITGFIAYRMTTDDQAPINLLEYLSKGLGMGLGPMWFVEVLIIFSFVYAIFRLWKPINSDRIFPKTPPSAFAMMKTILCLGLVTGFLRTLIPVGEWIPYLHLQIAHFPQYLLMLFGGLAASKRGWLNSISVKSGWRWFTFAIVSIIIGFPLIFYFGGAASGNLEPFMGGWHWQNFIYSIYEQIVGISLILGLLGIFKGSFNFTNKWVRAFSDSTYTVYVFHSILILLVSWAAIPLKMNVLLKFIILAFPCLIFTFAISWLIRKIPYFSRVL